MSRSAAIIVKDDSVALIKRICEGKIYFLFPGGTVEQNETIAEACIREIKEELGLDITIDRQVSEVVYNDNSQFFYLCHILSGVFGSGTGEEYQLDLPKSAGTYEPVWINIGELLNNDVRPRCICEMVVNGYPQFPKRFVDLGNGICVECN